jgi:hypothetical protein
MNPDGKSLLDQGELAAERIKTRRWTLVSLAVLVVGTIVTALVLCGDGSPRYTHTMRCKIECLLEKWGIIPIDMRRHIEG